MGDVLGGGFFGFSLHVCCDGMFDADVGDVAKHDVLVARSYVSHDERDGIMQDSQSGFTVKTGIETEANDEISERTIGESIRHGLQRLFLTDPSRISIARR